MTAGFTPHDPSATASDHGFVTISDSVDNERAWRYLLLTAVGTLKVKTAAGADLIIPELPAGFYYMGGTIRVYATGGTLNAGAAATVIGYY